MMLLARMAWRNVWRNRRRTILTIVAIAFGIFLIVVMRGLQHGSYTQMIDIAVRRGPGHIQLHRAGWWNEKTLGRAFPIAAADTGWIARRSHVAHVSPKLSVDALVGAGEERTMGARVVGVIPSREKAMTVFGDGVMTVGRFPTDSDTAGAVIGRTMAANLAASVGDEIVLLTQARDGSTAATVLRIRGIFRTGEPDFDGYTVIAHLARMQEILAAEGMATAIALTVDDARDVDAVQGALAARYGPGDWEVMTFRELMPAIMQSIAFDNAGGLLFLILLIIVIAFGILNTILMSVMERFHEFGVMMAIGMRPSLVAAMVFVEALILTVAGLGIGNALGWVVNTVWRDHPISLGGIAEAVEGVGFHPSLVALPEVGEQAFWSAIVLGLTLVVASWPALVATRFRPVEAIRQA